MKKISLFLLLTMLVSLRVCAYDYCLNDVYYNLYDLGDNDYEAEVISCDKKITGSVTIPAKLNIKGKYYPVLSIGEKAFQNCSGLTSVTIGNNVRIIGYMAFDGCSGLTSVTIPNCKTIKPGAFWNCSSLTSITIPYGVDSIAASAFRGCSSLKSITIPSSVKSIGVFAFDGCSGLTSVTIPYSVKLIGWNAFRGCSSLKSITIPNGVTSIGPSAFQGCTGLTSVTIPNSVTSIGEGAFSGCSGLASVHIIDLEAWCKISFGDKPWSYTHHLFMNGKEIKDLVIPNSVTSISDYAFYGCSGLTSVTIPNSVTSIGSYAFYDCRGLTSVTIPNSVTSIGAWAFAGCYGLTFITIPNSVTSIGSSAFAGCSGLTSITIPNSVTSIGYHAFAACSGLRSVTCETTSVPSTGNDVFYNVPLSSATLYVPVSALEAYRTTAPWSSFGTKKAISFKYGGIYYGFNKTTKQATVISGDEKYTGNVNIPETVTYNGVTYSVTSIGGSAFYGCSGLTSVTIPNSVTSIGGKAFYGCSGLTSVTIPNSVTSIENYAFQGCTGLTSVRITDVAAWCKISFIDNPLSYAHHLYLNGSEVKDLVIPNSVTSIGEKAFYGCSGLTSVTIPNSVTSIENYAFQGCTGLTSVTIGNSVTSIGGEAFYNCSGLTSITIPNSVTSIGNYAFKRCSGLTSIIVGSGNTKYDSRGNCNAIIETATNKLIKGCQNTIIPYSVTSIGESAFSDCSGLTSIEIPNSVTSIGESAFSGCSNLTSVTCEATSVPSTGSNVFSNVPMNSATLYVRSRLIEAYKKTSPWSGFGTIKTFNLIDGIYYGFNKTTKQATVISGDEKYTGNVNIPETVTYNGETSYSVTSIGEKAFYGCSGLTSVTIPNSVTSIGESAFSGCSNLTSVTIPNSVTEIEESTFYGCSGLTSVTIPNSVTSIGKVAFEDCSGLTSVTIGSSVTSIGSSAFSNCSDLKNVYCYAENVPSAGSDVFASSNIANATLYVPSASVDAYRAKAPWSDFGEIKELEVSGSCGDNVYYTFNYATGVLKITGTGSMNNYSYNSTPWYSYNYYIRLVEISDGVTSIGNSAFYGCSGLTSVTIPNGVTSIGSYAFQKCSGLTSVTIPNNVTSIGTSVFAKCLGLTSIIVEKGNTTYDSRGNCNAIIETSTNTLVAGCKNTIIPSSVKSIGNSAFQECYSLTSIEIPNSVTSIAGYAFYCCSGLTSITIPSSVTSIGNDAFAGCLELKSVTCEAESVPSTGSYVFMSVYLSSATLYVPASALETYKKTAPWSSFGTIKAIIIKYGDIYYLPNKTTKQATVVSGDKKYTGSVTISETVTYDGVTYSVTSIGGSAFSGCSGLTSVTIPSSVTSIGSNAFRNCSGLTSVTIPNSVTSIGAWAFQYCSGLTSVTIPNNVTSIGAWAFENCSGLTSVTIPNSVTSIGSSAFSNCSDLKNVYCYAENVPSTGSDVFASSNIANATLYVPSSSVNAYKKTAPWSGFGNILALPEPLNYYDYGLTMKTLTDKAEWANIMNSVPNAVAVAEAELEEWAASQTNVIVKKNNAYYCPNFILTDLTEIAGSGYEKTGFYSPYDFTVKKGSYRRQAYAGYNTICVPFSFTASDLSGTAKTYAFEHYDDGEGKAIFKRVKGTIAAGTPCIVKESGNVVWNINLANKKISARSSSEDSHMRGTFVSTDVYQGKGYSPNSVNEFSPLSQYLHPFRACLILGSVSGARAIRLVLDDAVTDIDEVEVDSATLKNGKYLEKGKLVIYKSGRKYNANGSTIK